MPYQNGKYVAPNWSNNAPPPINASELQAIADKCEDTFDKDENLSASTAAIYGVGIGYTPDKVFQQIATNFDRTINVTVTLDGSPIQGVTVNGITPASGEGTCITNAEGKTSGVTGVNSVTLTTNSGYVDVNEASQVVNTGGALETNVTLAITSKTTGKVEIKTSQTIKFNPKRTSVTYFIVGGGASGSCCKYSVGVNCYYIGGSGGGYTKTGTINPNNQPVTITIGAGGQRQSMESDRSQPVENSGYYGGATTITGNFGTVTADGGRPGNYEYESAIRTGYASGGSGGSGGGGAMAGGSSSGVQTPAIAGNGGTNGSDGYTDGSNLTNTVTGLKVGGSGQGTTTTFDGVVYSPGAGGIAYKQNVSANGTPGAGAGANLITGGNGNASDATTPGGAGGSAYSYGIYATMSSGAGAAGIAIFKW